jgi:hypothetical protein
VTNLNIGDSLHVSDLRIPQHLTVLTPEDETIVSVVPPPVLEVEEVAPEEELPEGEVPEGEEAPEGAEAREGEAPEGEAPSEEGGGEG